VPFARLLFVSHSSSMFVSVCWHPIRLLVFLLACWLDATYEPGRYQQMPLTDTLDPRSGSKTRQRKKWPFAFQGLNAMRNALG